MGCAIPVLRLRRDKLRLVATRVLGSDEAARAWMKAPHAALDGQPPEDLADTLEGLERALEVLTAEPPAS